MTTFKYCATGLVALAAMIGSATLRAENIAWFTENTTSVSKALGASGVSDDGTWATEGTLAESLYLGSGEQTGKVCVDTDGSNRLTYEPKVSLSGNTATVKLNNVCFTAAVEVDDTQLLGVQAAVAIVNDPNVGAAFKVADNGAWQTWEDAGTPSASDTYTVTCVFDYGTGKVTYTLGDDDSTAYEATIPASLASTKVSKTEFEGTCSFESLTGEKEKQTYTLTLPAVAGIASYTVNDETKASGTWMIAEGSTPTVTATLADGYFAKGTSIELPKVTGDVTYTADEISGAMELVEGEAMIGEETYKTLQAAADAAADSATIKVRRDVETAADLTFTNKTDIVFDLNGKTVTYTGGSYAINFYDTKITLTSSVDGGKYQKTGGGTLGLVGSGSVARHGRIATATVTVAGGTWYCASESGSCFKLENGTVNLNAGVVEHAVFAKNDDQLAFNVSTNDQEEVATLNLVGGTVKGYIARNAAATQTYNADSKTQFTIQQNELCAEGYEMVKGEGDYYTIQKKSSVVPVESVALDITATNVSVGASFTLVATVLPENATDKSVTWSTDNESFATVTAEGVVSAVAAGTATITVTTTDGAKTATCTVTVTGSTPVGPDPTSGEVKKTVTADSEEAAIAQVTVAPTAAATAAGVTAEAYDAYFTKTAVNTSGNTWEVTATLKEEITKAEEPTAEIAAELATLDNGFNVTKAKPGLFYSVKQGQQVTNRAEGNRACAGSNGSVTIPATKFDNSGFYQILVNTVDKAN